MLLGVIVFSWSVMGSGCTVAFFVPPKRSRVRPPIYTTVWDVTPFDFPARGTRANLSHRPSSGLVARHSGLRLNLTLDK
jgi:hypothetical protein